jgi:hypothetical protein
MLENPGRGIGKKSKTFGMQKGPIKDGESSWWHNHNRQKQIYCKEEINI